MRGLYTGAHHASYSGGLDRKLDTVFSLQLLTRGQVKTCEGLDRKLDTLFSLQLLTGGQVRTCEGWIKESSDLGVGMILQCDIGKHLPKIRALTIVVWTGQAD